MLEKNHKYPPKPKTIDELIIALKTICEELLQALKLHFCRRLCTLMLISIVLGLVSCASSQKSQKMLKNTRYVGLRSFKVIDFATNRTDIYDFLLVKHTECFI